MVVSTEQVECPVCGQYANIHDLGRVGLSAEELLRLRQYIKDGTLGKMLTIAEMIERRIDPTSTSMELSFNETLERFGVNHSDKLDQMSRILGGISEKIVGPGIGEVSELIAAQEFMQSFPKDEFDTSQADKHGTDIIATVCDRKREVGKISISIKNTNTWKNEFVQQLDKNTSHDSAKVGILISKTLPKRTNPKGEVLENNGKIFFLVSPQYGIAIYTALRQIVINLYQTQQYIDTKQRELTQVHKISKALAKWISGNEYAEILRILGKITENSETSREELLGLQDYVEKKVKRVCAKQTSTQSEVLNAENLLSELSELLQDTSPKEDEK